MHPPPHPIVTMRLVVWFLFTMPAVREHYSYVNDPSQKRIGAFLWLTIAISAAEGLITLRFSRGQFPHFQSHPPLVVGIWSVFLIGLNLFTLLYFFVFKAHLKKKENKVEEEEENGVEKLKEKVGKEVKLVPPRRRNSNLIGKKVA